MTISEEQWKQVATDLTCFYSRAEFRFGDMAITYALQQRTVFSNAIMTYINGDFDWEWCSKEKSHPAQRFLNTKWAYVYDAKFRKNAKKLSKKRLKAVGMNPDLKYEIFVPYWTSISSLIRHLKKIDGLTIVERQSHG